MKKMGIEGVGPKIAIYAIIYLVLAYIFDRSYHASFLITDNSGSLNWLMIILFIIGLILWISSAVMMVVYFPKGKLITSGPFRIFLNPLYNAFILFLLPALALYLNSWIFFGASIVFILAEKILGKAEEKFLQETFGKEYEDYRQKVWFKI